MEVTIQAAELSVAINRMQGVAGADPMNPIRSSILIRTEAPNTAVLTAFDGQMGVVCTVPATIHTAGSALLPFNNTVSKLIHSLRGAVRLTRQSTKVIIRSEGSEMRLWEKGQASDFPQLPVANVALAPLHATNLVEMIRRTLHAADRDGARVALCGAFLQPRGDGHRMVATDGKRLALLERPLGGFPVPPAGVVIPLGAVVKLQQLLENTPPEGWEMGITQQAMVVARPGLRFFASLADATFPNYDSILNVQADSILTQRERVLEAVRRVAIICTGSSACVRLTVNDEGLHVEAKSFTVGEAKDFFEVTSESPTPRRSHFMPKQVAELLVAAEKEEVRVTIPGPDSAALFRTSHDDAFTAVLMPMSGHPFTDAELMPSPP